MICYESKKKKIKLLLIFIVAGGIFYSLVAFIGFSPKYTVVIVRNTMAQIIGWGGLLYSFCGAIFYIFEIFRNKQVLIIDEKGINYLYSDSGFISWANIDSLNASDVDGRKSLEVWGSNFNLDISFRDIDPDLDKVVEYIRLYHPEKIK